jgi:hypothetical protein
MEWKKKMKLGLMKIIMKKISSKLNKTPIDSNNFEKTSIRKRKANNYQINEIISKEISIQQAPIRDNKGKAALVAKRKKNRKRKKN